jgi:acyl carrier protein
VHAIFGVGYFLQDIKQVKGNIVVMDIEALKRSLKEMIIAECDKEDEFAIDDILDDEVIMGEDSNLGLDSLDALQLSLAIKQAYNVRIEGAVDGRKAFASVSAMANYILEKSA